MRCEALFVLVGALGGANGAACASGYDDTGKLCPPDDTNGACPAGCEYYYDDGDSPSPPADSVSSQELLCDDTDGCAPPLPA